LEGTAKPLETALSVMHALPQSLKAVWEPHALSPDFSGDVCLDKVMERFNVQHTGLTLVDLFNAAL
jgi:hypothetical protein